MASPSEPDRDWPPDPCVTVPLAVVLIALAWVLLVAAFVCYERAGVLRFRGVRGPGDSEVDIARDRVPRGGSWPATRRLGPRRGDYRAG